MITLNFSVDDQLLTRTDENTVAANSHLVHTCEFVFSSEWNGRGKVATFKKRDLMLSVILDDDACTIPPEILQSENKIDVFELSVCGADGNSTITSTVVKVPILAGTWDVMSTEITPTMFEQIMQKIDEVEKGEVSPELIYEAVSEYMEAHPLEPIVAEDVAAYFEAHKSEFKGDKGDTGATGPQGPKGDTGATPVISATATVDNTTGTPSVNVTKAGTDAAPEFTFAFTGLKGEPGASYDDTGIRTEINALAPIVGEYLPIANGNSNKKRLVAIGATNCQFNITAFVEKYGITSASDLDFEVSAATSSGNVVAYNRVAVNWSSKTVYIYFDELTEQTTFTCRCSKIQ